MAMCALGVAQARADLANAVQAVVHDAVITYQEVNALTEQTADVVVDRYRNQPSVLERELEALATSTYITPVLLGQATVFEFLRRGNFEPNLERVSTLLGARRDAMLEALERELPDARWSKPQGGYFVWLELPGGADAGALLERATAAGVTFVPGRDFGGAPNTARLAFSFVSPDEIREGVRRLAALVREPLAV